MKTLHLTGAMAKKYGESFTLDVANPREMFHALGLQIPGFAEDVHAGVWHVVHGPLETATKEDSDTEETIELGMRDGEHIHLLAAVSGGGGNGVFSVILGLVLIVVGAFTGQYYLVGSGVGLLVGGIIAMSMKIPGADTEAGADEKASFLFSGPKNQSTQGVTLPRGYGRSWSGSIVVSAGLYAEDLPETST